MDSIGEGKENVDTAAQDLGLIPGLAVESDESRFDGALRRPHFLDYPDLIVRDVAKDIRHPQQNKNRDQDSYPDPWCNEVIDVHVRSS
jgi:hypothetical protein